MKDLVASMQLLDKMKRNSQQEYGSTQFLLSNAHQRLNQAQQLNQCAQDSEGSVEGQPQGYLSALMNPQNMVSLQAIELDGRRSNVYINTQPGSIRERDGSSSRRRKIILIKKKRHKDGSVESTRQKIYKDYGDQFAEQESVRLNSRLYNFASSASRAAAGQKDESFKKNRLGDVSESSPLHDFPAE